MNTSRRNLPSILLAAFVLALVIGGSATAAVLITSANIKDGTIKPVDLSADGRLAIKGAPCAITGHGKGKIQLITPNNGEIVLLCKTPYTTDNDSDGYSEAQNDCNDDEPEISPEAIEQINGKDDDCDGTLGFDFPFYTGPQGTENVGICHAGTYIEIDELPFYEVSQAEQTPQQEIAEDGLDNDCDGVIDEG